MGKSISSLKGEYAAIRANRATAAVLDRITVDYYGTATPINQLAAISVVEAQNPLHPALGRFDPSPHREGYPDLRSRHQPAE